MRLPRRLRHLFRRLAARVYWAAAETNRLNEAHYSRVEDDQSINDRISADLPTTRSRCIAEAEENPTVDGVIFTHQVDIVGRDGPTLEVQSESNEYNEWLEAHWKRWFRAPTPNPKMSGATLLRLWVRALWEKGEFLAQKITKNNAGTPVAMRVQPIAPSRLGTPPDQFGNAWLAEGVEIRPDGEPLRYHLQKLAGIGNLSFGAEYEPVPAEDIIHMFVARQEDQLRGVPWLKPALPTTARLAEYDADVGEAARQAASTGVYWHTKHPDAPYLNLDAQETLERGMQSTGPPGWEPSMLTPQQPTTQYKDYREECHADIGRPVCMPKMIVRLDAGRHNYSSARFDGKNYDRAVESIQYLISGSSKSVGPLSELVDDVAREAELYELSQGDSTRKPPRRPDDVEYQWTWPRPPHVDPVKERNADRIELEIGAADYQDVLARTGETVDGMIAKRKRTLQKLVAAGLPPVPNVMARGALFASLAEFEAAASGEETGDREQGTGDREEETEDDGSLIDAEV